MSDKPPRGGPLPLIMMLLLVVCLGAYVGVKLFRRDGREPVYRPPAHPEGSALQPEFSREPDKVREPEVEEEPPQETAPDPAQRLREAQQEEYFKVRQEFQALKEKKMWFKAREVLQQANDRLTAYRTEIDADLKNINQVIASLDASIQADLAAAREELNKGNFLDAARALRMARTRAPEFTQRLDEAEKLERELKERLLYSNMVRISGGEVTLGDPSQPDEPVRRVVVKPFRIDKYEVTNEQYAVYATLQGLDVPHVWEEIKRNGARLPVINVSYTDAEGFARWAGKRLPTEDEWERAARWIDGKKFPWGASFVGSDLRFRANCREYASANKGVFQRLPVGSFPEGRSPEDVYDLAGNVWEWTSTRQGEHVVVKGGSFLSPEQACRGSNRMLEDPSIKSIDLGFRCVADIDN